MRILYVVNVDWFFISHRLPLAEHALSCGDEVFLAALNTGHKQKLESKGITFIDIPFQRSGTNPLHEVKCISLLKKTYAKVNPDIIHHITLKAAILGSIAAKIAHTKNVINAISGFGYAFTDGRKGLKTQIIKGLLQVAFKSESFSFILQNPDDMKTVNSLHFVRPEQLHLIKGSGVDLNEYSYYEPQNKDVIECLFPARILRDKGVMEFLKAAKSLESEANGKLKFVLAGDCDKENLAMFPEDELRKWLVPGYIEWIGHQSEMIPVFIKSDIVILPSYREGLPKSLIEACAIGRPIITTDAIGCRECVQNNINGFLVPVKNAEAIADAIRKLVIDEKLRLRMGKKSRELAEKEFSINSVIEKTFNIYQQYNI